MYAHVNKLIQKLKKIMLMWCWVCVAHLQSQILGGGRQENCKFEVSLCYV
jgi:hypothetical protein